MSLFEKIPHAEEMVDLSRLPDHVGIIMDGNGRWAKERGYSRIRGHRAGGRTAARHRRRHQRPQDPLFDGLRLFHETGKRPQEEVSGPDAALD